MESLRSSISSNVGNFRREKFQKRMASMESFKLGRMRSSDGTFALDKGFDKPCGLKGGKLSGGQK